jgi:glycosyltransferase involved in cell wall biosynthesis
MPLTSIIIPTHERPQLLRRAVESARLAGSHVEIVLVDDGSGDETRSICASFPDVIHVRLEQRGGVGVARAAGIHASSGEYVSFLDDDDARLPASIDRQIAVLEAHPEAALVYGQVYRATQNLDVDKRRPFPRSHPSGDVFWELIGRNFIPTCSVVARRSAIEAVGGLFPEAAPADDWDLWLRLSERFPIAVLPEPVSVYRQPTLWSRQGSSRAADGLLGADMRVMERSATLPRSKASPRAFHRAVQSVRGTICLRLLAESLEAARHGDPYARLSFRHAVATSSSVVQAIFSPHIWRKLRERIQW